MTMPASTMNPGNHAAAAAAPAKKHRQTRIPEHLKAVKKGSSSASSTASSTSSSSSLKSSLAKALRTASSLRKSEQHGAAFAAASAGNMQPHSATKMDDVLNAQSSVSSPSGHAIQDHWAHQAPARSSVATTPSSRTVVTPHSATGPSINTQASIHSINGAPSPASARLPYALTHDRTNELAASFDASPAGLAAPYGSYSVPANQQQQQLPSVSRPSTSTSTMAQDSTLLARSCSSASSMAYSQPDFAFSVPSSQSLSSNNSSAFTHPTFDSSSFSSATSYNHVQLPIWPSPSGTSGNTHNVAMSYVQSPSAMKTSGSTTSLASLQQQPSYEAFSKPASPTTTTRAKRSYTNLSNMSGSSSSSAAVAMSTRGNGSPRSPATPFSASLILSVSSDGKARLTNPNMSMSKIRESPRAASVKSNTPKALAAAAMLRSSTTTNAVKTPLRPSMMRSNTTDPRMSNTQSNYSQKREVSELSGVGRVVGQGKMFDLHESQKNGMSFSTNSNIAALPQSLNLDIEMDLAAGMGLPGYPTSYSQVAYPYSAYPADQTIFTPPQSAEISKQHLPNIRNTGQPLYPEKERFQSGWKFPSGMGLNLHTASGEQSIGSRQLSASTASSSPSSGIQSSFPSMHSLNASIVNVMKGNETPNGVAARSPLARSPVDAASQDMSRRQSRIQAWLDSPDLQDRDDTGASSWSSLPDRSDTDSASAPPLTASSAGFSISPASIMSRTASEIQMSSASAVEEYEEVEVMRASGKSIRPLKVSKKRRMLDGDELEDGSNGPLSSKDRDAIKAGLGMPFQAASRQATPTPDGTSPGKRNRVSREDESEASKGRRGRRTKKKGSNICSCGTGDDGEAMILCDDCTCWFHLHCVGVDEDEIPERWSCTPCLTSATAQTNGALEAYPSPTSPLNNQLAPSPAILQTPKRPGLTREPTFSKTATPKLDSARHFDDAPLVAASSVRPVAIPSTPQSNAASFTSGHIQNASLSRAYAPVTPRVGFSGQTSAPGTNYQWDTYSPHTPSNAIAHSRRLSRQHLATPSSNWSHVTQWEDLPSSAPRRAADDSGRTKQWEQFYNAPPPASINPIPMTPPLASHPGFSAAESFLPPFEQEASVSQRFLAIHSTPSSWTDTSRFANNAW